VVAPAAMYAAGTHVHFAARQWAALTEQTVARLVRGRVCGGVGAVRGCCRALR